MLICKWSPAKTPESKMLFPKSLFPNCSHSSWFSDKWVSYFSHWKRYFFACSCVTCCSLACLVNNSLLFITCSAWKGSCGVTATAPGKQHNSSRQLEGPSSPKQETGNTSAHFPLSPPTYPQQAGKHHLLGSPTPLQAHRFLKTPLKESGSRGRVVRWHSLKMIRD